MDFSLNTVSHLNLKTLALVLTEQTTRGLLLVFVIIMTRQAGGRPAQITWLLHVHVIAVGSGRLVISTRSELIPSFKAHIIR